VVSLLDAGALDLIEDMADFLLELDPLGSGLSEALVGLGEFAEGLQFPGSRGHRLRPTFTAIGEHLGKMKFPLGASAVGLSAAASQGVDTSREDRVTLEEGLGEAEEFFLQAKELGPKGTELGGQGRTPGRRDQSGPAICIYYTRPIYRSQPCRRKK
jgi:hypothetical protein